MLDGGVGDDVLNGGPGADVLTGGAGRDVFTFADAAGADRIADFRRGTDKIDLRRIDANVRTRRKDAFTFIGTAPFSRKAGELRSGGFGVLAGDVDGNGSADFKISTGPVVVTARDLVLR